MNRCLQLAEPGIGRVAPNPMVGAVLVYENKIIGEGYHEKYGGPHAEVNCVDSVKKSDKKFISFATLYVSLEPCAHVGKTPSCADLIIKNKIPKVVIGCSDPFEQVNGKGIEKLKVAGVDVEVGVLEKECLALNKRFFCFHKKQRPYIILKWAESANGKIGSSAKVLSVEGCIRNYDSPRIMISNEYNNRIVHKWRSEEAAILVGTNTALLDNPELTTRLWPGHSPIRLVLDMNLRLPDSLNLFDGKQQTIIFNKVKQEEQRKLLYYKISEDGNVIQQMLHALYLLKIQSVLVEGGATLLQSFIDENLWDEARVIVNENLFIKKGLNAPQLKKYSISEKIRSNGDSITISYR